MSFEDLDVWKRAARLVRMFISLLYAEGLCGG